MGEEARSAVRCIAAFAGSPRAQQVLASFAGTTAASQLSAGIVFMGQGPEAR